MSAHKSDPLTGGGAEEDGRPIGIPARFVMVPVCFYVCDSIPSHSLGRLTFLLGYTSVGIWNSPFVFGFMPNRTTKKYLEAAWFEAGQKEMLIC